MCVILRNIGDPLVGADAGHSRSRRRSVTDVGLPLAGTHRPGRMHRFYGNLRRICNFSMGRQSRRPLQQPFALSVGADDSVRPRDVPILRESSANSQLPPTSKEVTACGFAANSRRNSLHSAGRAEPRPYQLRLHFNGFCVKQTVYGLKLMTFPTGEGVGCVRIRRNFSKKFTAFRRADKSSASTNSIRISVALCVSLTHFGLNLSQSRSPAQFLPQRRGLCFRRCAGQQLLIDGAVFFLQECRRAAILQTVQQDPQLLLVAGAVDPLSLIHI